MIKYSVTRIVLAITSLVIGHAAFAESRIPRDEFIGVGVEFGKSESGERNGGFVLHSSASPQFDGELGAVLIGSRSTEIRAGRGIGISGSRNTGVNLLMGLVDPKDSRPDARKAIRVLPVLGAHPAATNWDLNTTKDSRRLDYIEWSPHLSGGLMLTVADVCAITARGKLGASIGTLGEQNGLGKSTGTAIETQCGLISATADRTDIRRDGEHSRISRAELTLGETHGGNIGFYAMKIDSDRLDGNDDSITPRLAKEGTHEHRIGFQVGVGF